jgi:hypothetical protein
MKCFKCKCEIGDKHATHDDGITTHTWCDDCVIALRQKLKLIGIPKEVLKTIRDGWEWAIEGTDPVAWKHADDWLNGRTRNVNNKDSE